MPGVVGVLAHGQDDPVITRCSRSLADLSLVCVGDICRKLCRILLRARFVVWLSSLKKSARPFD